MRFTLLLVITLFFIACENKYTYSEIDDNLTIKDKHLKELSMRFLSYWDLKSQGKYKETFNYELAYQRYIKPIDEYEQFHKGNRTFFHVKLVSIDLIDKNTAMLTKTMTMDNGKIYTEVEKWLYIDNEWWHKVRLSKLPGHSKKEI